MTTANNAEDIDVKHNWASSHILLSLVVMSIATTLCHANEEQVRPSLDEQQAVLESIRILFSSMESRDVKKTKSVLLEGGKYYRLQGSNSNEYKVSSREDYLKGLQDGTSLLQERLIKPEVKIHNNIASVWSTYQFFVDHKLSHCGVDVFDLIKTTSGWRIASSVFTVETGLACQQLDEYGDWVEGQYIVN